MNRIRSYGTLPLLLCGALVASCSTVLGFEDLTTADPDASVTPDAPSEASEAGEAGVDADANLPYPDSGADVAMDVADVLDAAEEKAACGDTSSDPNHCGRCNHPCLGGTCVGGVCQAFELAQVPLGAWGLTVNDSNVFVAVLAIPGEIRRISKTPNTSQIVLSGPAVENPAWIAVDDQNIYWSNRYDAMGSIGVCALSGCNGGPDRLIENLDRPNGVASDGTSVYWAETRGGTIKKADVNGSNEQVLVPASLNLQPHYVALHRGYLYFTDLAEGLVARVAVDGGSTEIIGQSQYPWKLTVTDKWVYWTDAVLQNGAVLRVPNEDPIDRTKQETFAAGQDYPGGITADGEDVYWIVSADEFNATGSLRYCPHTGCPNDQPITMEEHLPYPIDVVGDESALYYTLYGIDEVSDGAVHKIAKP